MEALVFPPLFWGEPCEDDPLDHAERRAILGCDAGLVAYHLGANTLGAAMVFCPEMPLKKAMAMLPLCGIGLQNALGALAPPEVAVHLEWAGGLRLNGARCGGLRVRASHGDPEAAPDWLALGLRLPLLPEDDAPGLRPDETTLFAEGCADVSPARLTEGWARHTLSWISRWEADGARALHEEWRGLAHGIGEEAEAGGHFLGVDEDFGMILRRGSETSLIPLTTLLEDAP